MQAAFGPGAAADVKLALLGLRVDRSEHLGAPAAREAAREAVEQLLRERADCGLRTLHQEADTWWLLVPGLDPKEALVLARALVEAGRELAIEVQGRRRRLSLSCGLAHARHRSQPSLATCVAVVEEGLRVAAAGGGRRAVHSEVYAAFTRQDAEAAPLVDPVPPARSAREVELPRAAPTAIPAAAAPPRAPQHEGPASPAAAPIPQRDWGQWLQGGAAAPEVVPAAAPAPAGEVPPPGTESELLHRRLTKMTVELEKAEAEIARLRASLSHDRAGLASIYREVQGLADDAPAAELKREMMERLFQANVALRELNRTLARSGASA